MDKRWIAILIILLAGLSCMYVIVDTSNTVGNAITVVKDVSMIVPPGYKIDDSSSNEAKLSDNNSSIIIEIIEKNPEKEFKKRIANFENKNNVEVKDLSNKTLKHIQFKNSDTGQYTSFVMFDRINHTMIMKLDKFDTSSQIDKDVDFIISNMKHDFKQNK